MLEDSISFNEDVIKQAIDSYIYNQNKAKLFDLQLFHHHGKSGIKRAEILLKWLHIFAQFDDLDRFLENYIKQSPSILDQLINIAYKSDLKPVNITHVKKEAEILIRGNNTTSSLRTYVKNAYESINRNQSHIIRLFTNNQISGKSFFTYNESELGLGPIKVLKTSAKEVKIYDRNNTFFFMKPFNLSSKGYHKKVDDGLAEVIYAQIWRYLIGERASESRLVIKDSEIIGICSKGLKDFKEYGKMTNQERLNTKGLISIMIFVYLLMEDDFHIYNYGMASFQKGNEIEHFFGKVDHDYIVEKWDTLSKDNTKFDITKLSQVLKTRSLVGFINLLSSKSRFNPSSGNNFLLRAAHTFRANISSRRITTTSRSQGAFFRSYLATSNNVEEFYNTIVFIKQRCNNLEKNLSLPLKEQLNIFSKIYQNVNTNKANQILEHFINRIQILRNELGQN